MRELSIEGHRRGDESASTRRRPRRALVGAAALLILICSALLGGSFAGAAPVAIVHEGSVSFGLFAAADAQPVTVPAVSNGVLVFGFSGKVGADQLSSVTYGGQPLTKLAARSQGTVRIELWYLVNPPAGTRTLAWQKTGSAQNVTWGASVYSQVDQSSPFGAAAQTGATGDLSAAPKTVSVTSAPDELVVSMAVFNGGATSTGPSAGAGQDLRWSRNKSTTQGGSSSQPGAASVAATWTPSGGPAYDWALLGAPLRPAGTPPAQPPAAVDKPVVSGNTVEGETLQTTNGTWSNNPSSFAYSWLRCDAADDNDCDPISGANAQSYTLVEDDIGTKIRSRVIATNDVGPSAPSDSDPTATVTAPPAPSPLAHVASTSFALFAASDSKPVTVDPVSNGALLFAFAGKLGSDQVTSVTYGGTPLTRLAARSQGSVRLELWYLLNPPAGTAPLAWLKSGAAQNVTWGASLYSGVDQTSPFGAVAQTGATADSAAGPKTLDVAAVAGELVADAVVFNGGSPTAGPVAGPGQTQHWSRNKSTTQGGSSSEPAASPVQVSWTPSSTGTFAWALIAAALRPAGGAPPEPATPANVTLPVVTGSPFVGATLETSDGTWTNGPTSFSYRWKRCDGGGANCSIIGGATSDTYMLQPADEGFRIRSEVTATNGAGDSEPASSEPTATVGAAPTPSPITHVSTSSFAVFAASASQAVTVSSVADRVLVFSFAGKRGTDQLTSVTYAGQPLTPLAARSQGGARLELWYLVAPPAGTAQLAWTKSGASENVVWAASVYSGVNQSTPFGAAVQTGASADASSAAKTLVVPAGPNELVVDAVVFVGGTVSAGPLPGAGQTTRFSLRKSTTQGGGSTKPSASPVSVSWTPNGSGSRDWALIGAPLKPADANDAPTDIALSNSSVAENQPVGTTVGTLSATDPDPGDTHTFTLVAGPGDADNASFQITGSTLQTNAVFDFETKSSYSIRVRASDGSLTYDEPFTITITDVVENAPPTDIQLSNSSVAENQPGGTNVGTLTTTDPDAGDTHTYSLVAGAGDADNAKFQISGSSLETAMPLDFEADSSLLVRIRTTDGGSGYEETFTITVTNANDAPSDLAISNSSVAENQPAGTNVGTLSATDQDGGATHTFSLVAGAGDGDNAKFQISGSTLQTAQSLDFEAGSSLSVRVRADDGAGGTFEKSLTITVTNVNDAPTDIALDDSSVAENQPAGTVVGNLSGSDADLPAQTLAFTLSDTGCGGSFPDNASFSIVGTELRTAAVFDNELKSSYLICIRVTDDGAPPAFYEEQFTITVEDVAENAAPTDIALSNASFTENQAAGTNVGTLTTTDPNAGDTHVYSLVASSIACPGVNNTSDFQIGAGPDADKLQTARTFDFETDPPTFMVCVRTTDSGSPTASFDEQFALTLLDANEAPTDISLSPAAIDENMPAGSPVGTLSATDVDAGQTHSFSLVTTCAGHSNSSFAIVGDNLQTATVLDFETTPTLSVCVRVTDDGSPPASFDELLTVTVNDVNDAPVADDEAFNGASRAVGNTSLVGDDPSDGAPDPAGPQKTIVADILDGDTDQDAGSPPLVVVAETKTTNDGGTVILEADGDFTFHPATGTSCMDTSDFFDYTVSDQNPGTPGTDTGRVTIEIQDCVWYVDASAGPGDGRSHSPLNLLAGINGAGGAGDPDIPGATVFLYDGMYPGGLELEGSQRLFSQRHGLVVPDGGGGDLTLEPAVPGGPNSTILGGLVLGTGNTIQGIDLGDAPGMALSGSSVGTATMNTVTSGSIVNTAGGAVSINGATALTMVFPTVSSSTSTTNGIALSNVAGAFTAAGGSLADATGADVLLNGGTADFTYLGTIQDDTGQLVSVTNQTGGTKAFAGAISDGNDGDGNGIALSTNTGASILFTGGLTLSTGPNPAFLASSGGTVTVTGTNTLATTTGTPLIVANTTIGSSDLTFQSISSNGAGNGILLTGTGSTGGLTVTGTGSPGSGGTIQGSIDAGISLTNVGGGVSLDRMNVSSGGDDGIRASTVSGFTLANSVVSNNGNAVFERGLDLDNVTGAVSINATTVTGSAEHNARIDNDSGATTLTVANSTFSNNSATLGAHGLVITGDGTAAINANVTGNTFAANRDTGFQLTTSGSNSATLNLHLTNNTVTGGNAGAVSGGIGILLSPASNAVTQANITGNTITGTLGAGLTLNPLPGSTAASTFDATVANNSIGNATAASGGFGLMVKAAGAGDTDIALQDNTITQWKGNGLLLRASEGTGGSADFIVTGNVFGTPNATGAFEAVYLASGSVAADTSQVCADIGGATPALWNDFAGDGRNASPDMALSKRFGTALELVGYGGVGVEAYIRSRNAGLPTVFEYDLPATGTLSSCTAPTLPPGP